MKIDYTYQPRVLGDITLTMSLQEAEVLYQLCNLNILDGLTDEQSIKWPKLEAEAKQLSWDLYHRLGELPDISETSYKHLRGEN